MADNTGVLPWWGERWHKPAFVFFLLCWALSVTVYWRDRFAPDWMTHLVLGAGLLTSLVTLGRQLPLQNIPLVVIWFIVAGGIWGAVVPTSLDWSDGPGWPTAVFWGIVFLNARGIGQYLLRSRRKTAFYGWELIGVTAGVVTIATALYRPTGYILVAPLAVAALLVLSLPLTLGKRSDEPPVSWQPIVVLLLLLAWSFLPRL